MKYMYMHTCALAHFQVIHFSVVLPGAAILLLVAFFN